MPGWPIWGWDRKFGRGGREKEEGKVWRRRQKRRVPAMGECFWLFLGSPRLNLGNDSVLKLQRVVKGWETPRPHTEAGDSVENARQWPGLWVHQHQVNHDVCVNDFGRQSELLCYGWLLHRWAWVRYKRSERSKRSNWSPISSGVFSYWVSVVKQIIRVPSF